LEKWRASIIERGRNKMKWENVGMVGNWEELMETDAE
jgi:hypothetical protein